MLFLKLFSLLLTQINKTNPPVMNMLPSPLKKTLYFFVFSFISISALAQGTSELQLFK
jgi:hypothetical protein